MATSEALTTAKERAGTHAGEVADEARTQVRGLADQSRERMGAQADHEANRAANGMQQWATQLRALAEGRSDDAGQAQQYVQQAAEHLEQWAGRIERDGFRGVMGDVQRFARRRPGAFLLGAGAAGFLAGRMLRNRPDGDDHGAAAYDTRGTAGVADRYGSYGSTGAAYATPPSQGAGRDVVGGATTARSVYETDVPTYATSGTGVSVGLATGIESEPRWADPDVEDFDPDPPMGEPVTDVSVTGTSTGGRRRPARGRPMMAAPDAPRADAGYRAADDRSLGELFSHLADDMGTLVRKEFELARLELREEVDASKRAGAMLGATALTGYLAVLLLSFAAAWGLAEVMPEGVAFLIIGVVYAAIAAVAWTRTRTQLRRVRPVPQQTVDTVKEDMQWARQQLR